MLITKLNIRKRELLLQLFLVVIIFSLYSFSWHYPIYSGWDDIRYILKNKNLSFSLTNISLYFSQPYFNMYHPLTMLSYMFDYNVWGFNSFGYHLQNIFWHTIATLAIYKCFRLFEIKSWIAFFLCLIFAVHPQRVESVVWLSERKDVLCAAFYFLCIYFYIKNYGKKFSITAFLFFILSILSKSMAISLPIVLLLYEFYRYGKDRDQKSEVRNQKSVTEGEKTEIGEKETVDNCQLTVDGKQKKNPNPQEPKQIRSIRVISGFIKLWLYFLVLFIFIPITIIAQGEVAHSYDQILSFQRLYTVLYNIYWYFRQTVFPAELNPVYPLQIYFINFIELILFYTGSILIIVITLKKNWKFFVYGALPLLLAFLISLLPVIGIISLGSIDHADRYSYIPSIFIWFSLGLILTKFLLSPKKICINQNSECKFSDKHLSFRNQYKVPLSKKTFVFVILFFYSAILFESNYQYQKIWKNEYSLFFYSAACIPSNYIVLQHVADIELALGNYNKVLKMAEQIGRKDKGSLLAVYFKASVAYHLGRKKSTIKVLSELRQYFESIAYNAPDAKFHYLKILDMLVDCYYSSGKTGKAVDKINELLQFKQLSEFKQYFYGGLKAYYLKKYFEAIPLFKKALELKPGNIKTKQYIQLCLKAQKEKRKNLLSTNLIN